MLGNYKGRRRTHESRERIPGWSCPPPSPSLTLPTQCVSLTRPDSENNHHPRSRRGGGKFMVRHLIACRVFIGDGLVC